MNKHLLIIPILCFLAGSIGAQSSVFPGDANANGRVDHHDILAIGYGFGQTGPARITEGTDSPQLIPLLWDASFPSGLNVIHADANGNGLVELTDFFLVDENFGNESPPVTELTTPVGISGLDATLVLNENIPVAPMEGGDVVNIPIVLTNIGAQDSINGLSFSITYSPEHYSNVSFSLTDNWLAADNAAFTYNRPDNGQIDVAITRFGRDPIPGGGTVGVLSLVIIDDLIGLLPGAPDTLPSWVKFEDLFLADQNLEPLPVVMEDMELKLYRPGVVATERGPSQTNRIVITPNPAKSIWQIESETPFERVWLVNALGQSHLLLEGAPRRRWQCTQLQAKPGWYWLRISGAAGEWIQAFHWLGN